MDIFNESIPIVNAKDLLVNTAYKLNRLVKVPSKFGETVAADIVFKQHVRQLFLPAYIVNRMTDDAIKHINEGSFDIIYEGKMEDTHKFSLKPRNA